MQESQAERLRERRPAADGSALGARRPVLDPVGAVLVAVVLVAVIALIDYVTGYELRFAILYLLPIALATYSGGERSGIVVSLLAGFAWLVSFRSANVYSREIYYYWEGLVMVATFLLFVLLLSRLRTALQRADERFVRVVEGLHAGVYVVDQSGRILYANDRLAQMVGVDARAVSPADFDRRFAGASLDSDALAPSAGEKTAFRSHEVRDESTGRWYLIQSGPIPWVKEQSARLRVITDISEQKRAQMMKRQHDSALHDNARLIALGEVASMLAHEINQPLVAIAGYNDACLRLLASGQHDAEELKAAMEKCRNQVIRAGHVVNRMRDFIKRRQHNPAPCDLNAVIRDAVQATETELERGAVAVDLALARDLPAVLADRILVTQVVINLIRNGIEAMESIAPASRRIALTTLAAGDGNVTVKVRDTGEGIPEAVRDRLFTPFFTTKAQGIGLGLNICHSVIESYGGRLWYTGDAEHGGAFQFTLPAIRA